VLQAIFIIKVSKALLDQYVFVNVYLQAGSWGVISLIPRAAAATICLLGTVQVVSVRSTVLWLITTIFTTTDRSPAYATKASSGTVTTPAIPSILIAVQEAPATASQATNPFTI
jgi:hypothetical protein